MRIPCMHCNGSGQIPVNKQPIVIGKFDFIDCKTCNGTGQIDIPLAETCPVCDGDINLRPCSKCDNRGWMPTPNGQEIRVFIRPFVLETIRGYVDAALSRPLMKPCPMHGRDKYIPGFEREWKEPEWKERPCPTCHGTGKIPTEAGREILELVKMFGKE